MRVKSVPNSHAITGISDKPYSGLDVPKYTPYKDGKGRIDFGTTPVVVGKKSNGRSMLGDTIETSIFDVDKYWPFYLNQKNWLLDNCRSSVYQDINKKKSIKAHREMRHLCLWHVSDLESENLPRAGANPNWEDWGYDAGLFDRASGSGGSNPRFIYRNYYGGPTFEIWGDRGDKYGLEELARSVQEDLCILRRTDNGWVLRAAAVCFPSYWSLNKKMGKPLIIDDNADLLDGLDEESPVERFEWMLTPDVQLYQPSPVRKKFPTKIDDSNIAWSIFIRTERQIFMKLPNNDVLFTTRTYLNSLVSVCQNEETALGLKSSMLNTPTEMLKYRGIDNYGSEVIRYIDRMWVTPSGCAGFHR